jgi:hypothetical protein
MAVDQKVLTSIAEKSFAVWAAGAGGESIAELSKTIPKMESVIALGSENAAKKKLWKAAEDAVTDTGLGILIEGNANAFPTYPGVVAGSLSPHMAMPNTGGSFSPDVFALPRFLVKEYALRKFVEQRAAGPIEKISEVLDVDAFLSGWVEHFDAEYIDGLRLKKEPSYLAKDAIAAAPNWLVYGFEADYEWKAGVAPGHFFLTHDTLKPGQRPGSKERKEVEANVVKLETELAGYDLNKRAEIVAEMEKHLNS